MIVRLFAVLLAFGMLVISAQGPDFATPDTAAIVDDADEAPPITVIESAAVLPDRPAAHSVLPEPGVPAGHRPEIAIFRPPRTAAFV